MTNRVVIHFYNAADGKDQDLADWFTGSHASELNRLRGFERVARARRTDAQIMPEIAHPWEYMTVYDFDVAQPEIHLPALASLLADPRDTGLIKSDGAERIWTYDLYHDWSEGEHTGDGSYNHLMMLPANVVPGREAEYHSWYNDVHRWEVLRTPGFVGFRRGCLSQTQLEPKSYCPGNQLVLAKVRTDDLKAQQQQFIDLSQGRGPADKVHGPRTTAASSARTNHYFRVVDRFSREAAEGA